jgi:glycerol-3-phosphate acyltransferase PlsX
MPSTRIALDVMGGDRAPEPVLAGALRACSATGGMRIAPERIVLVGDEPRIRLFLEEHGGDPGFAIRHASQVVGMGESPASALRAKPDSSIASCVAAVKADEAGAVVSMGNTGACVGAATLGLGTLPGVRRPGIAVTLELTGHPITLLDMGANIAPKPDHLVQYAEMGSVYMRDCLGVRGPRVGLLNVGEEKGKGTELLKQAFDGLEASGVTFVGNVEGGDLFRGVCDVVVTDGFTGNVVLKLLETFATFMLGLVMQEIESVGKGEWGRAALAKVKRSIDYSTYGGALLLGVDGVTVIGHGRSDETAVANAIALAARAIDANVNQHIVQGLAARA